MGIHSKFSGAMQNFAFAHMLLLALIVATVAATPVERINGVTSIGFEETVQVSKRHLTTNSRDCPQCDGVFLSEPYHLIDTDARRVLAKRSPQKEKKFGKKAFIGDKKGFKKLGKGGKKAGKKSKPFVKKGGKKSKPVIKKGGKKSKKGIKKGGKTLSKGAKASAPFSIPAGGGALAFGVPFTGFDGVVVPGLAAAGFDYVAG